MNICVAGGTGFLGRHIARALLDDGHSVTVLSRNPSRVASIPELAGASAVAGDVTEPTTLRGSLNGCDGVVQAVQFPNHPVEAPRKGLTYDRYDRQGTENLLEEALQARAERFFYLSGAGADARSGKSWYLAKGRAEDSLRSSGITWSILRPSWAYGPEDRALNRLAAIARFSPVVPRLGWGAQRVQPVHSDDVSLAVARVFARDPAWGKVFEIGGDVMTMDDILRTMLDVLGLRRAVVPVPAPLAKFGTAPLTLLPKPFMTPQGIEFAIQDGLVDTSLVHEVLDVHPVSLRAGLARYMGT